MSRAQSACGRPLCFSGSFSGPRPCTAPGGGGAGPRLTAPLCVSLSCPALPGPGATLSQGCPSSRTSPGNGVLGTQHGEAPGEREPPTTPPGILARPPTLPPNSHCTCPLCANACEPQGSVPGQHPAFSAAIHRPCLPLSSLGCGRPRSSTRPSPAPAGKATSDVAFGVMPPGGKGRTRSDTTWEGIPAGHPGTRPDGASPRPARAHGRPPGVCSVARGTREEGRLCSRTLRLTLPLRWEELTRLQVAVPPSPWELPASTGA